MKQTFSAILSVKPNSVWFLQFFSLVFTDILQVWFPQVGPTELGKSVRQLGKSVRKLGKSVGKLGKSVKKKGNQL